MFCYTVDRGQVEPAHYQVYYCFNKQLSINKRDFTTQKLAQEWEVSEHFVNFKKNVLLLNRNFKNRINHAK